MVKADIYAEDPTKIVIDQYEWRFNELIKNVPSSSFRKDKFLINLTWPTALALKNNLGENLEVSDSLKAWMADYYTNRILPAYQLRSVTNMDEGYEFLFPHQKADVQFLSTARRAILANGMGSGKAQPISEPVLTPSGWTKMGDLEVGDLVIGKSGKPIEILATYPQGVRDVYKVTFKDGSFANCDLNHLWDVQGHKDTKNGRYRILTTRDLIEYGVSQNSELNNLQFKIPLVEPVEFEKNILKIPAYLMGALLGDGGMKYSAVTFTSADQQILDRVSREIPIETRLVPTGNYGHRISVELGERNPLIASLRSYALLGKGSRDKFIPVEYKFTSVDDRIDLLRGLMDTDGTVGKTGNVSYCTVSPQLAYDVREIVQSLGGTAVINYHKRPKLGNYDPFVVTIKLPSSVNPFYLDRKASLVPEHTKYPVTRFISSIEFSHKEESKCLAVDSDDRLYVTRDYVVTHNSISATASLRNIAENLSEDVFPVFIACPNSTKVSWGREFEKAWPGKKITVINGTATQRRKQFKDFEENGGDVLIMNWESIRFHSRLKAVGGVAFKKCAECGGADPNVKVTACETHDKELNSIKFKSVIGDEIHRISDPKAKGTRAFKYATGDADIRIALSGTPIMSTPDDLFSALNWLYPTAYPSKTGFLDRFCDVVVNEWGASIVTGIKKNMQNEFFAGLDPILRRMPKEVILPFLPPVLRDRRDVEMGTKQAKAYKQMNEKMVAELDNGDVIYTTSPLTKMGRLLQFASAYGTMESREVNDKNSPLPNQKIIEEYLVLTDPSCKIDAFMEDLPDFGESSVVVFAQSKQLINLLAARLDKHDIKYGLITGDQDAVERQAYMDSFQAGNIKYILCTIQAGGTGITLTKADTMVFLQRSWSMIDNQQAEARAHRIGSQIHEKVQIIDYVTSGSVEEYVFEAIAKKLDNLEFILRDKDLIRTVLKGGEIAFEEGNGNQIEKKED